MTDKLLYMNDKWFFRERKNQIVERTFVREVTIAMWIFYDFKTFSMRSFDEIKQSIKKFINH